MKKLRSLISIFCIICFISGAAPTFAASDSAPGIGRIIYENNFESGGALPDEITTSDFETGSVNISGGKLVINRGDTSKTGPTVYFHTPERSVNGLISVEMDLTKPDTSGIWLRCGAVFFYWRADNILCALVSDSPTETVQHQYAPGKYSGKLHIQFVYDTINGLVSYWINGALKLSNAYSRSPSDGTFENCYVYMSDGSGEFTVDNFKSYYALYESKPVRTSDEIIYQNSFDSNVMPNEITANNYAAGDVSISDGKLVIDRGDTSKTGPTVYFYPKDKKSVNGLIGVEMDVQKPNGSGIWLRSNAAFYFWRTDNFLQSQVCNDSGSTDVLTSTIGKFTTQTKLKFIIDTETHKVKLYVNGAEIEADKCKYSRTPNVSSYENCYLYFSENSGQMTVDNYKVYYVYPDESERLDYETKKLTVDDMLVKPFVQGNIIDSDCLKLPTCGYYGSPITWTSSNVGVIDEKGIVTRTGWDKNPTVTLTAHFKCGAYTAEKSFDFTVLRDTSSDLSDAELDMNDLDLSMLLGDYNKDENNITTALKLVGEGVRGSKILWASSNTDVITESGRVIRPKAGDGDKKVTMTALIDGNLSKSFEFTVKQDELTDMQHHPDEEFFGLWKNNKWEKSPRINYSYNNNADLKLAENAAKSGNYSLAKKYVLDYWRTRKKSVTFAESMPLAYKIASGNIYHENGPTDLDIGIGSVTAHEFKKIEIPVDNLSVLNNSASLGLVLMSLYSDNGTVSIYSRENTDSTLRPHLEMTVNGVRKSYEVKEDVTVKAGKNENTCYGKDKILNVRMLGDYLGDDCAKTFLRFEYDKINSNDKISSAKLVLYAKLDEAYAKSKDIAVLMEKSNFTEESTWKSLTGFIYSWDGIPGKNTWATPNYASSEYLSQMCRFNYTPYIMAEYSITKNEDAAYLLISQAMDFLADQGMMRTFASNTGAGTSRSLYGNYLACAGRAGFYTLINSDIIDSKYMSPEAFGTLLKAVWDYEDVIYRCKLGTDMVNWGIIFYRQLMQTSSIMPELVISDDVFAKSREALEAYMLETTFEDGSYKEAATGYTVSSLATFRQIKQILQGYGFDTSKEYDERLKKSALYNIMLQGARYTRWGDSGLPDSAGYPEMLYKPFYDWFGDTDIVYIGTYGQNGTKPDWTSKLYKDSMICFMHSDWSKNQTFMFMNARGQSNHAHADDNHIFLSAKDRTLLVDCGIGTYDNADFKRKWLVSTIAHNTVEINGESQPGSGVSGDFGLQGKLYKWTTTNKFDFLSQGSISYRDNEHRRTVTFVKPDMIIVSDRMTPDNLTKTNTYKQAWHTPVDSSLSIDNANKTAKTNYASGANLYISCADDVSTNIENGYYDYSSGQVGDCRYMYFGLEKSGAASIDTVLFPYEGKGSVKAERLNEGYNSAEVSALKITADRDGKKETSYFILNYDNAAHSETHFGGYKTNAEMAIVTLNGNGTVISAYLADGSYIKDSEGKYLINCSDICENAERNVFSDDETKSSVEVKSNTVICKCEAGYVNSELVYYAIYSGNKLYDIRLAGLDSDGRYSATLNKPSGSYTIKRFMLDKQMKPYRRVEVIQ